MTNALEIEKNVEDSVMTDLPLFLVQRAELNVHYIPIATHIQSILP